MSADLCDLCQGRKVIFQRVAADVRREIPCPRCGGAGTLSAGVERALLGEDITQPPEPKESELAGVMRKVYYA